MKSLSAEKILLSVYLAIIVALSSFYPVSAVEKPYQACVEASGQAGTVDTDGVGDSNSTAGSDQAGGLLFIARGYRWWSYGQVYNHELNQYEYDCGTPSEFSFPGTFSFSPSLVPCVDASTDSGIMRGWGGSLADPKKGAISVLAGAYNEGNGPTKEKCVPFLGSQICYPVPTTWGYSEASGYIMQAYRVESGGTLQYGDSVDIQVTPVISGPAYGVVFLNRDDTATHSQFGQECMNWGMVQDILGSPELVEQMLGVSTSGQAIEATVHVGDVIVIEAFSRGYVELSNPYNRAAGSAEAWSGNEPVPMKTDINYASDDGIADLIKQYGTTLQVSVSVLTQGAELAPYSPSFPDIRAVPDSIDFEGVITGQTAIGDITIQNTGTDDLLITDIAISGPGPFSQSSNCTASLNPGASCKVTVSFKPVEPGTISANLTITSNDPDYPSLEVALSGNGINPPAPDIVVIGGNLVFSDVQIGASQSQDIVIKNSGQADLHISDVTVSGAPEYAITSNNCLGTLPHQNPPFSTETCTITVEFTPSATNPVYGTINITSDDPDTPVFSGYLSGNGVTPAEPAIEISPGSLDFGPVLVGETLTMSLSISNSGNADLELDTTLSGSSEFSVLLDCTGPLLPGHHCPVSILFSPSTTGQKSAALSVNSNDPSNSVLEIPITGMGDEDSDYDGVVDSEDFCPQVMGSAAKNGCPSCRIQTEQFSYFSRGAVGNFVRDKVTGDITINLFQEDECFGSQLHDYTCDTGSQECLDNLQEELMEYVLDGSISQEELNELSQYYCVLDPSNILMTGMVVRRIRNCQCGCANGACRPEPDQDQDGLPNCIDDDIDGDGIVNALDADDDNDGCLDADDAFPSTYSADTDGDGIHNDCDEDDDNDGCIDTVDPDPVHADIDTDGDGTANPCDADDDNDGCPDLEDRNPLVASPDSDNDGVRDDCDNCLTSANLDQSDFDRDGEGDACDCDDHYQGPNEFARDCGGQCAPCGQCSLEVLPVRFDWRDHIEVRDSQGDCITETCYNVKNQGMCGSCWAFSAVGAVEGSAIVYAFTHGSDITIDLSEQELVSDCGLYNSCFGGYHNQALDFIQHNGIVSQDCFPYWSGNCLREIEFGLSRGKIYCDASCSPTGENCDDESTVSYCDFCSSPQDCTDMCTDQGEWKIDRFFKISGDLDAIKRALICHGPLSVASANWQHAFVIVGYDDDIEFNAEVLDEETHKLNMQHFKGAWIMRNSWGANWHATHHYRNYTYGMLSAGNGHAYIPYEGHPYSDLKNLAYYIEGIQWTP